MGWALVKTGMLTVPVLTVPEAVTVGTVTVS